MCWKGGCCHSIKWDHLTNGVVCLWPTLAYNFILLIAFWKTNRVVFICKYYPAKRVSITRYVSVPQSKLQHTQTRVIRGDQEHGMAAIACQSKEIIREWGKRKEFEALQEQSASLCMARLYVKEHRRKVGGWCSHAQKPTLSIQACLNIETYFDRVAAAGRMQESCSHFCHREQIKP